jgi:hypothetical protein
MDPTTEGTPPVAQGTPTGAQPSGSAPLAPGGGGAPAARGTNGGPAILTEGTLRQIKETAARRGAEEALAGLDSRVKKHGFGSLDEALAALARGANGGGTNHQPQNRNGNGSQPRQQARPNGQADPNDLPPPPRPPSKSDHKAWARYERERQQWQAKQEGYKSKLIFEADRRRAALQRADALEAEMQLQRIAWAAGVKDVDYAVHLYQRKLASMGDATQEELSKLDHNKFFGEELKQSHPYLFTGEVVTRPATTGTGVGGDRAPPTAAEAAAAGAQSTRKNARDMTAQEYTDYLASKGLRSHSAVQPGRGEVRETGPQARR